MGFQTPLKERGSPKNIATSCLKKSNGCRLAEKVLEALAGGQPYISGYMGQVPCEAGRFGGVKDRLRQSARAEFRMRQGLDRALSDGYFVLRSGEQLTALKDSLRKLPELAVRTPPPPPDIRNKRRSLAGYEYEVTAHRSNADRMQPIPLNKYEAALVEARRSRPTPGATREPKNYFDPYSVLPSLEPYRYPLNYLRKYQRAIRNKLPNTNKEWCKMFEPKENEDDNAIIHRYMSHVTHPRKILNYTRRLTTEIEFCTHPEYMKNNRVRRIDKVDFVLDI